MPEDNIEKLIDQAHQIFNQTSVFEVIDMDRESATATLLEFYESADDKDIKRYLDVVDLLRVASGTNIRSEKYMKPVSEILIDFNDRKIKFHKVVEHDLYRDALTLHMNQKFTASASLCAVLYEMVFTTRLIREIANPTGFIPSKENLNDQLQNLQDKEGQIINDEKYPFRKITKELADAGVITNAEKTDYDDFYTRVRNPVAHGLLSRLYEPMCGKEPENIFEIDVNYKAVYSKASEILLDKIYEIMAIKKLLKT